MFAVQFFGCCYCCCVCRHAPQAMRMPLLPTRAAYDGNVSAITNEASVYSLQIWVFTHDTKKILGHYSSTQPSSLTTSNPYELIQISIDDTYAETSAAPAVSMWMCMSLQM